VPGLTRFGFGVSVGSGVDVGTAVSVGASVAISTGFSVEAGGTVDSTFATDVLLIVGVGLEGFKIATGTLHRQQSINNPEQPIATFPKIFCFENHAEKF